MVKGVSLAVQFQADTGHRPGYHLNPALISTETDADDMVDELIDRFGDPPSSVNALISVALLRSEAGLAGITDISQKSGKLLLRMEDFSMDRLVPMLSMPAYKGRIQVVPG